MLHTGFISVALRPDSGSWSPLTGLHDFTHLTGHILQDSSGRVISSSQRPLTTHNTLKRHTSMAPAGFELSNFSKRAAADPRLRPRGYWDRHVFHEAYIKKHLFWLLIKSFLQPDRYVIKNPKRKIFIYSTYPIYVVPDGYILVIYWIWYLSFVHCSKHN